MKCAFTSAVAAIALFTALVVSSRPAHSAQTDFDAVRQCIVTCQASYDRPSAELKQCVSQCQLIISSPKSLFAPRSEK